MPFSTAAENEYLVSLQHENSGHQNQGLAEERNVNVKIQCLVKQLEITSDMVQ